MKSDIAISVQDVHFSYEGGRSVLKGLSCEIHNGEKVALIGPNGAGKSTFMSLLNGVSLPTQGSVAISGMAVEKSNLTVIRRKVGIVFQDPDDQLFCPTVFDDVAFGPLNLGLPKAEIEHRVRDALALVGLDGFEQRSSFHMSFGERKRLALATVLSYQPDILVFDEPSTNMDPLNRRKLIQWLRSCDKTMVLCTHDLDIALEVCDRCLVLNGGSFVADGPASDILHNRQLLEQNNLELPLALMTHVLLEEKLRTGQMSDEDKNIIAKFLHVHRHVHGGHEHVHIHMHPHDHGHLHDSVAPGHIHGKRAPAEHEHLHESDLIQHDHHHGAEHEHSHDHHHHDHSHHHHDHGDHHDHDHHHDEDHHHVHHPQPAPQGPFSGFVRVNDSAANNKTAKKDE